MSKPRKSLPFWTKLAYGLGSIAYGVKNNGFDYFLLIFYSQVLGVDAPLVGLALLGALMIDAFSDPVVGYISDNTHSRFGRRHPFMYAAVIPVSLTYFLLWNPPANLSGNELLPYLFVLAVLIRTCITLYEVPSSALAAELSDDYDERTSIVSFRYFFGWIGGTAMATFALSQLMKPTEAFPNGLMNKGAYADYGVIAASVIFASIMIAALGTHRYIPKLKAPPPKSKKSIRIIFGEIFETLSNRSFLALFGAALFGAVASGVSGGLSFYINGFFWEFSTDQIALIAASIVISAILALVLSPVLSKTIGKKRGAILSGVFAFTIMPAPIFLRLAGMMPANGDPVLFPIILGVSIIGIGLIITLQTLMAAMIADLVEESEVKTARRSEGVFFAAITFTQKSVQGLGVLSASIILALAQFPKSVAPGEVPEEALFQLGAYFAPTLVIMWTIMILWLSSYKINRQSHEDNLLKLKNAVT